jgi:hypothetical protein
MQECKSQEAPDFSSWGVITVTCDLGEHGYWVSEHQGQGFVVSAQPIRTYTQMSCVPGTSTGIEPPPIIHSGKIAVH